MAKLENAAKIDPLLGIVFRDLRNAKGFTQKDAAGSCLSLSIVSRFESGKASISAHHFFQILGNICTNMYEFQYSYEQHLDSKNILLFDTELSQAYMEHNVIKLKIILERLSSDFENDSGNIAAPKKKMLDIIRVKTLIATLEPSFPILESERNFLINYFRELKEWGQYDILLLGHCVNIIDTTHLYIIGRDMINPKQSLIKLHYVKHSLIQTMINIIGVLIDSGDFIYADTFISYLDKSDIHEYYMYEKLTLIYNKAMLSYKKGDSTALTTLEKCKEILIFCDCLKTANMVDHELSELPPLT